MRLRQVDNDRINLEADLKEIADFLVLAGKTEERLAAVRPEEPVANGVKEAQAAFAKLKEAYKPGNVEGVKRALFPFGTAVGRLSISVIGDSELEELRQVVAPLPTAWPEYSLGSNRPTRFSRLPASIAAAWRSNYKTPDKGWESLPETRALANLASSVRFADVGRELSEPAAKFLSAQSPPNLAAVETEVSTKLSDAAMTTARSKLAATVAATAATKKEAADELEKVKKLIEEKTKEEAALDQQIRKKEESQEGRQDRVSKNLQPVFWGIMGAIIFTIVALRIRSDEQSLLMVRERTAAEMLSIGMFLMTILFLGTGEFLQKETLGTLLGTLAGYLFTRRASEKRGGDDKIEQPEQPVAPEVDATAKTIRAKLPKGANYMSVFARDPAGGNEQFLGTITGAAFDVGQTSLAKGKQYAVWLVAHGAGGVSPASPPALIQL
jgi:hypothetical protein